MRKEKQIIGVKRVKKSEASKSLGKITIGKSRPDKTKYVLVDINYDEKAEKELYECGMLALKHDKEAVIAYVVNKAMTEFVRLKRK